MLPAIEKSGLMVTDIEILRLHYAETLKHWRERFLANRERAKAIYDERFCRMWEFYLAGSEAAFRWQDLMVFQIQLTRRNDTVPITRDYIEKCEKALAMREAAPSRPRRPHQPGASDRQAGNADGTGRCRQDAGRGFRAGQTQARQVLQGITASLNWCTSQGLCFSAILDGEPFPLSRGIALASGAEARAQALAWVVAGACPSRADHSGRCRQDVGKC